VGKTRAEKAPSLMPGEDSFPVSQNIHITGCINSVSSHEDDGTRRPICQKKLLPAMKHFSIFHVFTSKEKIS
jgi:hypothetical protein